ncbi:MAG: aryl-sulfate sulfotransferase [Bacteroidota bacterium]
MKYRSSTQIFSLLFVFLLSNSAFSQLQPGIRLNTQDEATPGYVLLTAFPNTYIIDNCGEIVHTWPNISNFDLHAKLLPNGNLVYISNNRVVERDWSGQVVNAVQIQSNDYMLKYEVILLPNQNYLCVARKLLNRIDFDEIGYNIPNAQPTYMDAVVELNRNTGDIEWLWLLSDHVIQQRDPDAPNYGILSENPQLINMDAVAIFDWNFGESFMINGMDYNPELDQIALSVRKISEIVIIDHSTSTKQAAGHTGGRYGKGGDVLYRWGNPQNYGRGTAEDRELFFQHNPNWILEGPHKGKIICYNNGLNRPNVSFQDRYSSVPIITPPVDADGNYILEQGKAFGPVQSDFQFDRNATNTYFYSGYTSAARALENGNFFITEGVNGRLIEINSRGETVWEYIIPDAQYIFRAEKYHLDYSGLDGQDLSPDGTIEFPTSEYNCNLLTSIDNPTLPLAESFTISYFKDGRGLRIEEESGQHFAYRFYDLQGRLVEEASDQAAMYELNFGQLPSGLYLLQTRLPATNQIHSHKIIIP